MKKRCAVVGLGMMGLPMAQHLVRAGHQVVGVDIRSEKRKQLQQSGAHVVASLAEAELQTLDSILLMVVSAEQISAALESAWGLLPSSAALIVASTISQTQFGVLNKKARQHGLNMFDAPVSGGNTGAEAGTLTSMIGSPASDCRAILPLVQCYSEKIYHGEKPGDGMLLKILHQHLAGIHVAATMEAFALCEQVGVNSETFRDVVTHSAGNSWMFEFWAPFAIARDLSPRSTVDIFSKDLACGVELAQRCRIDAALLHQAHQLFCRGQQQGKGGQAPVSLVDLIREKTA